MNSQTKVRYTLQSFPRIITRGAKTARKISFMASERSEGLLGDQSKTQKDCGMYNENDTSNSRKMRDEKKSTLAAIERKLRRQSFFEHVCGSETSNARSEMHDASPFGASMLPLVNKSDTYDKFESIDIIKCNEENRSRANTSDSLKEYVDMSFSTTECDATKVPIANESQILNFRIKKTKIVKRAFSKFELVPLLDRECTLKTNSCFNGHYSAEYRTGALGSDITDLLDELSVLECERTTSEQLK